MHGLSEQDRTHDLVYCMLADDSHPTRTSMCAGISKLVGTQTKHPAILELLGTTSSTVEKALLLAALHIEPDFLRFMLEQQGTCSSTLSEYTANVLPGLVGLLLDGNQTVPEFVTSALHAYVRV
jgi:hypothetical protein